MLKQSSRDEFSRFSISILIEIEIKNRLAHLYALDTRVSVDFFAFCGISKSKRCGFDFEFGAGRWGVIPRSFARILCQVGFPCFDDLLLLRLGMLVIKHWLVVAQASVQWQFQLELSKGCLCGH